MTSPKSRTGFAPEAMHYSVGEPLASPSKSPLRIRISRLAVLESGFVLGCIGMRLAAGPTGSVSYLLLAGYAMVGRAQAIQALALSWLFTMLSPGIAPEAAGTTVGRFVVIGAAACSVLLRTGFLRRRLEISPLVAGTILLGLFLVFHSVFVSPVPAVSVLKAASWTTVMATLLAAWSELDGTERAATASRIFAGLIAIMLVSLPLLAHPLGYLRTGTGFQGVLSHPQVFGPVMALLGAWAASQVLTAKRPAWALVLLAAACPPLVLLSQARTAGLALVLGIVAALILVPFLAGRTIRDMAPGIGSRRFAIVASVVLMGSIAMAPVLGDRISEYLSKGTSSNTLLDAYEASRGGLIEEMWINIQDHPFIGIGFGIASTPWEMKITRDPVLGIPVGAAIEKGVMPVAVLEEVGIPGAVMVAVWLFAVLRRSARSSISCLAVASTGLFLNFGEATLFSPGGIGLLFLILLGWAATGGPKPKAVPVR